MMTIQNNYDIRIHDCSDGLTDEYWPEGCQVLAFVWNTLAGQKAGNTFLAKGAALFFKNGYCGRIWIGSTGEWNVSQSNDNLAWSGYMPINEIITELRSKIQ